MRFEKVIDLLNLARAMTATAEGLTLDEMMALTSTSRRTVERMRDAVEAVFGTLDRIEDGRKVRFRIAAQGLGRFAVAPTSQELTELENAVRSLEARQDPVRAELLRTLEQKIRSNLREADRRRLEIDVEDQLRGEALACNVGPRPTADMNLLSVLRRALLSRRVISFQYESPDGETSRRRKVVPYGVLLAPRYYLVARAKGKPAPVLYRLDRMHDVEVTDEDGGPPVDFSLAEYAAQSFGVFQEDAEEIALRFAPSAARDARQYLFHPTQIFADEPDGSLTVKFRAGGLLQIAYHLMTWGTTVSILSPKKLQTIMKEQTAALHRHYR